MILNRDYFRDLLGIALAALVPLLVLKPLQNTPFIDDWTYAWSVENLLQTGELQILDNSSGINVAQILWGTIFCVPFGFSFTALRLSTWTLSVACLFGLYLTLRELGISRQDSLSFRLLRLRSGQVFDWLNQNREVFAAYKGSLGFVWA